jgi:outer membrane protein assembly factor BamD (BamD/ComL family)
LEAYQALLREEGLTPKSKGFIYFECASLAFSLQQYRKARENALAPEVDLLALDLRFRAKFIAAQSLDFIGDNSAAIAEMESLLKTEEFSKFKPEVDLALGIWYLEANRKKEAFKLFKRITKALPKSALAAEAFFRMGEYTLNSDKDEKNAIDYYTASSECGDTLEYAIKAKERAASLKKLQALRLQTDSSDSLGLTKNFYMAELFLFNLDNFDSAVSHINTIVNDTSADSASAIKASYARAFIYDEFKDSTKSVDSLYRYVIERFPNTDYAKQAEINMGKVPETITEEDKAHQLFLEAEKLYFGGYDYTKSVIPAYKRVIDKYPKSRYAGKAQFVIAMLHEFQYERGDNSALFLAKQAHAKLRKNYPGTEYFEISNAKLLEAGIREGDEIKDTPVPERASGDDDVESEYDEYDDSQYEDEDDSFFEEAEDSPEVLDNDVE